MASRTAVPRHARTMPVTGAKAVASATGVALLATFAVTGSAPVPTAAPVVPTGDFRTNLETSTQTTLVSLDVEWESGDTVAVTAEEPAPEPVVVQAADRSSERGSAGDGSVASYSAAPPARMGSVVETAMQYLGYPYVYGTAGPSTFDCSGFTQYIFGLHGITLPRGPAGQGQVGYSVPLSEAQPGDLFIAKDRSHVGIYIGDGQIIHASDPVNGVTYGQVRWYSAYDIRRL